MFYTEYLSWFKPEGAPIGHSLVRLGSELKCRDFSSVKSLFPVNLVPIRFLFSQNSGPYLGPSRYSHDLWPHWEWDFWGRGSSREGGRGENIYSSPNENLYFWYKIVIKCDTLYISYFCLFIKCLLMAPFVWRMGEKDQLKSWGEAGKAEPGAEMHF